MKTLFLFMFMLACVPLMGQARLGYSPDELREDFKDSDNELSFSVTDDGILCATVEYVNLTAYHFFYDNQKATISILFPSYEATAHGLIEYYNNNYVIISPRSWRAYMSGNIADIELDYADGNVIFVWTLIEE